MNHMLLVIINQTSPMSLSMMTMQDTGALLVRSYYMIMLHTVAFGPVDPLKNTISVKIFKVELAQILEDTIQQQKD